MTRPDDLLARNRAWAAAMSARDPAELEGLRGGEQCDRLCEMNAIEQALNMGRTTIVEDAWGRGQDLTIHGWIYSLQEGLLRDLGVSMAGFADVRAKERMR